MGSRGGGRRGYRGRERVWGREEGLQGPWVVVVAGRGATGAVRGSGGGRRGYRGREGIWGREEGLQGP